MRRFGALLAALAVAGCGMPEPPGELQSETKFCRPNSGIPCCTSDGGCAPQHYCCLRGDLCMGPGFCYTKLAQGAPCTTNHQCLSAMCKNGVCAFPLTTMCGTNGTCPTGDTSCNKVCTDTQNDVNNCGLCASRCFTGNLCCKGACLDPQTN